MAVMITAELPGMTQEHYERLAPYILEQVRETRDSSRTRQAPSRAAGR
jgi:hypothetical protein